jgi:hypothetical protein
MERVIRIPGGGQVQCHQTGPPGRWQIGGEIDAVQVDHVVRWRRSDGANYGLSCPVPRIIINRACIGRYGYQFAGDR